MPPSPTAAATRFTDPERTSPTAKIPGTLVSRANGSRSACQCPASIASAPVKTKPCSSRAISEGSQSVTASAPMRTNSALVSRRDVVPALRSMTSIASSCSSPCTATTSDRVSIQGDGQVCRVDAFDPAGHDDLSAQPLRLLQSPARELVPRDAEWEPRVVLDPSRSTGLPAWSEGLDQPRL